MPIMPAETKATTQRLILRVVQNVETARGVSWVAMLSADREGPPTAAARVLAMAVCCAAGIPMHLVGRAFNRTWQTVDSARQRQTTLAMACPTHRDEFIRILTRALEPSDEEVAS